MRKNDQRYQQVEVQYNANRIHFSQQFTSMQKDMNRQRMLAKVQSFWITGVLKQSLQELVPISLTLYEQPDAVARTWHIEPDQSGILPPNSQISQIYNEAGGELLILGEAGSGKTTLLLELTQNLLNHAQNDETHLIPIVFHLSSWIMKHQPLVNWLVEELSMKYQIRPQLAETWVKTDKVLPLLDGLDEVPFSYRSACIDAINLYKREHMVPMVVCSRSRGYHDQKVRLLLRRAIVIQPLTVKQIDDYISNADKRLATIHEAFQDDEALRRLVRTPLMLSIMIMAYQGVPMEDILTENVRKTRQQQLFAKYVQRMLHDRGSSGRYTPEQTINWLAWIAKQLKRHTQTEFYIEGLQPNWLLDDQSHPQYSRAINTFISMPFAVAASLTLGSIFGFLSSILLNSVIIGWVSGVAMGLLFCFVAFRIINIVKDVEENTEIEYVEVVVFSKEKLLRFLTLSIMGAKVGYGMLFGFTLSLIVTIARLLKGKLDLLELFMVLGLLCVITAIGILGGLTKEKVQKKNRTRPNQGTWKSAQNSLVWGLASGISFGGACGIAIGVLTDWHSGIISGLLLGFFPGLAYMAIYGGEAWVRHAILRLHLWRLKYSPLLYAHFLSFAVERALLYKVGGSFIFIHTELRDYFAEVAEIPISGNITRQVQPALPTLHQKTEPKQRVTVGSKKPTKNKKRKRHNH